MYTSGMSFRNNNNNSAEENLIFFSTSDLRSCISVFTQLGAREALHAAVQEPVPPPHRPLPLHPQHRLARPDVARRLAQLQRPQASIINLLTHLSID